MSLIEKLEADVRYHTAHVEGHTAILKGATGAREKEVAKDALEMAKNDCSAAEQLLAAAKTKSDTQLDLSSPVTGLVRVSAIADLFADSIIAKCDSGERIGHRVDKLKDELQKLNDQLRRAIANKDAEEIRDIRKEIENVEADIKKRSRSDSEVKSDAMVDVFSKGGKWWYEIPGRKPDQKGGSENPIGPFGSEVAASRDLDREGHRAR